ncbi:LacI family transcriptional regulator [Bhargavaea cecembensis]|uniref:LacI family transcriptional regulator n=1 Tax=Bhargavaea cecembensis TaxID=394098 RepID=A0A161STM4_9BACL|nr:LacI family DNA-binding transcriptional regulator [Bhargavaea cecembensis]KZE39010.1 LacI family transcriptional regulator [Bhargavaea cecembensis]
MKITMKEIAKEANVSVATVSHVINGTKQISKETHSRVMGVVRKYNYMPNQAAKTLKRQKTMTAALVVSSLPDTFVSELTYGVEERAREMGYHLMLVNTNENVPYEKETINVLHSNMVDGIILSPTSSDLEYLNEFTEAGFPIVLVNRYHPVVKNTPRVTGDNYQTGYDATLHLLEHGHRDIGIIYGVPDVSTTNDRIRGYRDALEAYGIPFNEDYLELGAATKKGAATAAEKLLTRSRKISALFILNDLMTIGTISKLKEMNLLIPDDVAIIGFGDFPSAEIIDPPVTNIIQPPEQIGRIAFDILLDKIENPESVKHVELPANLVIRKSCGC